MSPRGASKDNAVTACLRENGLLLDERSFISQDVHLYLYGKDKVWQRERVVERANSFCEKCGKWVPETGEWHHKLNGLVGRCDCLHNAEFICRDCHSKQHIQIKWTVKGVECET